MVALRSCTPEHTELVTTHRCLEIGNDSVKRLARLNQVQHRHPLSRRDRGPDTAPLPCEAWRRCEGSCPSACEGAASSSPVVIDADRVVGDPHRDRCAEPYLRPIPQSETGHRGVLLVGPTRQLIDPPANICAPGGRVVVVLTACVYPEAAAEDVVANRRHRRRSSTALCQAASPGQEWRDGRQSPSRPVASSVWCRGHRATR
jgi:hypothetical protein